MIRSTRQEQRELASDRRAQNQTWVEIAEDFSKRYRITMRTALRLAHGWSQGQAADRWNARWPGDPKTFKNFSYWEQWPSPTGHAPSLDVLTRLADLYQCRLADLVVDCADFRNADDRYRTREELRRIVSAVDGQSPDAVSDLLARLDELEAGSLATVVAEWMRQTGKPHESRDRLLKLSAALSLAAVSKSAEESQTACEALERSTRAPLSGIWHSRYAYPSTGRNSELTGEHFVAIKQNDRDVVGESLPHSTGSELRLALSLNNSVVTGTWSERTSTDGYYQGAVYHGSIQLIVDPSARRMQGRWVGFGRDFTVNSGTWELTKEGSSLSKSVQRGYHLKL